MILDIIIRPGLIRYLEHTEETPQNYYKSVEMTLNFDSSITLTQLLEKLHIPIGECGLVLYSKKPVYDDQSLTKTNIVEKRISDDYELNDNGIIKIYPPILGG